MVGLEIEAGSVAATEVHVNGRAEVTNSGVLELEPGVFSEGQVGDVDRLADALRELVAKNKLGKDVRLGVANQRVVVRVLHLPVIEDPKELDTAVRFQAQEQLPMPSDQATIDWQQIPSISAQAGDGVDVVAVAARTDMVVRATDAMHKAGLRPIGIDHSAFGMIRALGHAHPPVEGEGVAVMHCSLGDQTNLAVALNGNCRFTRVTNFGVEAMAQQLAERTPLSLAHARQWIDHVGLEEELDHIQGDPQIVDATRQVLTGGSATLADELRMSLEYYASQENALPVGDVLVSGVGSAIPGLVGSLEAALGRSLTVVRPSELSGVDDRLAARLTVPFGLALSS